MIIAFIAESPVYINNDKIGNGTAFVYKQLIFEYNKKRLYCFTNAHVIRMIYSCYDVFMYGHKNIDSRTEIKLIINFNNKDYPINEVFAPEGVITYKCYRSTSEHEYKLDFAIFSIETDSPKLSFFPISHDAIENLKPGQSIFAFGFPNDLELGITDGIISNAEHPVFIQHNMLINPGNSGGPMIDKSGNVIGICVSGLKGSVGINYSINMKHILEYIKKPEQMECVNIVATANKIKKDCLDYSEMKL